MLRRIVPVGGLDFAHRLPGALFQVQRFIQPGEAQLKVLPEIALCVPLVDCSVQEIFFTPGNGFSRVFQFRFQSNTRFFCTPVFLILVVDLLIQLHKAADTGLNFRPVQIGLQLLSGRLADVQRSLHGFIGLSLVRYMVSLLVNGILFIVHGTERVVQLLAAVFQIV